MGMVAYLCEGSRIADRERYIQYFGKCPSQQCFPWSCGEHVGIQEEWISDAPDPVGPLCSIVSANGCIEIHVYAQY